MTSELRERVEADQRQERRTATRALLMRPYLPATDEAFGAVRRQAAWLRDWFARQTGWSLQVDRAHARLRKTPVRLTDATRGARARPTDPLFSRRRYVLLCLALAVLADEERQTALGRLAERIVGGVAADAELAAAGVRFTLEGRDERRDLVAVARLLMAMGVLRRVDGDEAGYVAGAGDALYTVDRAALAAALATRCPPSMVRATDLGGRLAAICHEPAPDTPDARNRVLRHRLMRRLLDDAVLWYSELDAQEMAYLTSQRARLVAAVEEATGLVAEIRAEGIAMVDEGGELTDLALPQEGTEGHVTLLVAEHLAAALRRQPERPVPLAQLADRVAAWSRQHGSHWRQDARDAKAAPGLAAEAVQRLAGLDLVTVTAAGVWPRPAIARFAVDEPVLPDTLDLFASPET